MTVVSLEMSDEPVFLCHASHLHALNLVSDVEHEVVVAHHLYVVEQAHDETADAEVACHVGGEEPVARVVVDGRDAGRRGGIFLYDEVAGELVEEQGHGVALLAAEHEEVGEHLLVFLLRNPFNVEQLHLANACELERLVGVALYLVTPYIEAVVHEEERLHNAVAHRLAVGRRVVAQHAHTLAVHGLFQHLRVAVDGIDTPKFAFLETVIVVLQKIKLCKVNHKGTDNQALSQIHLAMFC